MPRDLKNGDCIFAKASFQVDHEICDSTFTNTCGKCVELSRYRAVFENDRKNPKTTKFSEKGEKVPSHFLTSSSFSMSDATRVVPNTQTKNAKQATKAQITTATTRNTTINTVRMF